MVKKELHNHWQRLVQYLCLRFKLKQKEKEKQKE